MLNPLLALLATPLLIPVQTGVTCKNEEFFVTKVNVILNQEPINYIRDISAGALKARLQKKLRDRQKELGMEYYIEEGVKEKVDLDLSGTHSGNIEVLSDVNFMSLPQDPKNYNFCLIFKDVTVTVNYHTEITIASELKEGECAFEAVKANQLLHHEANVRVVEMLTEQLRADLPDVLTKLEHNYVSRAKVKPSFREMKAGLQQKLDYYQEDILGLMEEYTAKIDSPEAIRALADSCKEE